ncbi:MAG: isoprenylcysteine carboxylmethyltransferase family protein [Clostridia bacterium]|nr:isoprenylcysteine carboxylmethyltransferase family protein [Clostridia bacterium]
MPQETLQGHFGQWLSVLFFVLLYGSVLFFVPFYKKVGRKPTTAYLAFVVAFAIEMHGIPLSMYLLSAILGHSLPEGVLWGHTLSQYISYWGMYINILLSLSAVIIIVCGWRKIYKNYWSKEKGDGQLVTDGIYKYIRHPQYTGFFLLTLGMTLEWASLPLLVLLPVIFYMYIRLAKREEADMIHEFGDAYKKYMKKTKRFIPFVI